VTNVLGELQLLFYRKPNLLQGLRILSLNENFEISGVIYRKFPTMINRNAFWRHSNRAKCSEVNCSLRKMIVQKLTRFVCVELFVSVHCWSYVERGRGGFVCIQTEIHLL